HVNLGTFPGEKGHWIRQGRAQLASNAESVIAAGPGGLSTNLTMADVPFQPWARELYHYRQANFERDAPHSRCKPSPGPRQVRTRYGFELVEMKDMQRVFISILAVHTASVWSMRTAVLTRKTWSPRIRGIPSGVGKAIRS